MFLAMRMWGVFSQYFFFFRISKNSLVLISAVEQHSAWYIKEEFGFESFFLQETEVDSWISPGIYLKISYSSLLWGRRLRSGVKPLLL